MYSVVLMMTLGGGAELPDFGHCRGCSCSGYYYDCSGCQGCRGRRARCCGCYGTVVYTCGCGGRVVMPPAGGEKIPSPKKMKDTSADLVVTLPADAKLTINGQATTSTSGTRWFVSPPLEPGRTYTYQLRAEIVRDEQRRILSQEVTVRAGEQTRVSMMDFTNAEIVSNP